MTSTPPPTDSYGPYGTGSPTYGLAPTPGGGGYDPYADPTAFAPAGQPGSPLPGGQGPDQGPPSGKSRRGAVLISVALIVLMAGLALVGWFVWPGWGRAGADESPSPSVSADAPTTDPTTVDPATTDPATTDPTTDPATTDPTTEPIDDPSGSGDPGMGSIDADGRMSGPGYSYDVPAGWTLAAESGGGGTGTVEDGAGSDITVWIIRQGMNMCVADVDALQIWVPGTIEELPDREIDGVPAIGNSLHGDDGTYHELWCSDVGGVVYEIGLETTDPDTVQPQFLEVLDGWTWG